MGSVGGFDVASEFDEEYFVYSGVCGYSDHRRRLHAFKMRPTENESQIRPGRSFLICFNRKRPRVHHLFPPVRLSHPMRRYDK